MERPNTTELLVLGLLAEGLTQRAIAIALGLSHQRIYQLKEEGHRKQRASRRAQEATHAQALSR